MKFLINLVNHTILIHIDSRFEQSFHLKGPLQDSPSHMVVKPLDDESSNAMPHKLLVKHLEINQTNPHSYP